MNIILFIFVINYASALPGHWAILLNPYNTIDLTHSQDENAKFFPRVQTAFKRSLSARRVDAGGIKGQDVTTYDFMQNEHVGTHMDAPTHFVTGARSIDEIPLSDLMGPGIVFDVRRKSNDGQDNYFITKQDFLEWETYYGKIPSKAIVFIFTGNYINNTLNVLKLHSNCIGKAFVYSNETAYLGWKTQEDVENRNVGGMHYPGLSEEACNFLIHERNIVGTGIDTVGIDVGNIERDYKAHRALLGNDVWIVENLNAKLADLPARGFYVMAFPYKLRDGTGAPTRVVAMLNRYEG